MKRWKHNILKFSEADKLSFDTKISEDKTKFEDTTIYKTSKKNYEDALKAYDAAVLAEQSEATIEALLTTLEDTRAIFDTLVNSQVIIQCEDSGEICPQLGERVLFLDNYNEIDILDKEIIQLSTPFYFDTGTECITITKDNYNEIDCTKALKEKPTKYIETEI